MGDDVRLLCGCWGFCDLSCMDDEGSVLLLDDELDDGLDEDLDDEDQLDELALEENQWDPRDDYDEEDIPGSRFDPDCEDDPM